VFSAQRQPGGRLHPLAPRGEELLSEPDSDLSKFDEMNRVYAKYFTKIPPGRTSRGRTRRDHGHGARLTRRTAAFAFEARAFSKCYLAVR